MRLLKRSVCGLAIMVLALGVVGCGESAPSDSPETDEGSGTTMEETMDMEETTDTEHTMDMEHGDHDDHAQHEEGADDDMAKMKESLADLSADDRAAAEKQHSCPVTDKMLGTMGVPVKVQVEGRDVWACCSNCESKILEEPSKYLAKLK
ncbi:MAG: hypothetical protein ACC628_19790 [Pirellulaceae bacterium]